MGSRVSKRWRRNWCEWAEILIIARLVNITSRSSTRYNSLVDVVNCLARRKPTSSDESEARPGLDCILVTLLLQSLWPIGRYGRQRGVDCRVSSWFWGPHTASRVERLAESVKRRRQWLVTRGIDVGQRRHLTTGSLVTWAVKGLSILESISGISWLTYLLQPCTTNPEHRGGLIRDLASRPELQ